MMNTTRFESIREVRDYVQEYLGDIAGDFDVDAIASEFVGNSFDGKYFTIPDKYNVSSDNYDNDAWNTLLQRHDLSGKKARSALPVTRSAQGARQSVNPLDGVVAQPVTAIRSSGAGPVAEVARLRGVSQSRGRGL